jgi:diguanylate cyclase (GGDEF)-like protein
VRRRVGLATTLASVADAVLSGCKAAYPQTTWGGLLVADRHTGHLESLPVFLGPAGIARSSGRQLGLMAGEGITGRVFASGEPLLLRGRRRIQAAYATTAQSWLHELERLGGGQAVLSFIAAPLRSPDQRVIGVLVLNAHHAENAWERDDVTVLQAIADEAAVAVERARLYEVQRQHALTDPLTRAANRRALEQFIREPCDQRCSILAIDVDDLKMVNDEYGHEAGDLLLIELARTLSGQVRSEDLLARVGGDEFVAVLPGIGAEDAEEVADRMRRSLEGVALPHGTPHESQLRRNGDPLGHLCLAGRLVTTQSGDALGRHSDHTIRYRLPRPTIPLDT